ncbi:calcium/calmodulin-dependent protein kinase, partial [Thraustotheca clavata]
SEDDRDKWVRLLTSKRSPKYHYASASSSSMKMEANSSSMVFLAPSAPKDIYLYIVGQYHDELPGDAIATAKMLAEEFPIFVALVREIYTSQDADVLVHILDQIVGEVHDGAWNDTLKKILAIAAEQKLAHAQTLWTDTVKTAYVAVMKAMHKKHHSSGRLPKNTVLRLHRQQSSPSFASAYTLGRVLGSGAHSVVRVGWHHQQMKQVAVKCIVKSKLSAHEQSSLLQEVSILKQLHHPNIVPLLDFIEEEAMYYIVTPLCTGGELFQDLIKRTQYTENDARTVMSKLASAVAYIHAQHIMHRDIKPENVLLYSSAPGAEIMLADFGFARLSLGNHLGTACGTPGYIAPEVVKGVEYGVAVDCWSLGVLLFILLSGQPPFPGHNHADILSRVAVGAYSMDAPQWKVVSPEAKALVRQLLCVNPKKRLSAKDILTHPWILKPKSTDDDEETKGDAKQLGSALEEMRIWRASGGSSGLLSQACDDVRKSGMKRDSEETQENEAKRAKVETIEASAYAEYGLSEHAPQQLLKLVQLFASLEFSLTTLNLYKRTPTFSCLRQAIESSSKCTFREHELAQILTLLPQAYELTFSKPLDAAKDVLELTINFTSDSLSFKERVTLFCENVNEVIAEHLKTSSEALDKLTIKPAELPKISDVLGPTPLEQLQAQEERHSSELTPLQQAALLAKPIPKELQGLPLWLVNKVRLAEHRKAHLVMKGDFASAERMAKTLPQLADQLQSYSKCIQKSAILMPMLEKELTRAPIREKIPEHIELLASKVPTWITIVPYEKTRIVRLNLKQDFRAVKKILKNGKYYHGGWHNTWKIRHRYSNFRNNSLKNRALFSAVHPLRHGKRITTSSFGGNIYILFDLSSAYKARPAMNVHGSGCF